MLKNFIFTPFGRPLFYTLFLILSPFYSENTTLTFIYLFTTIGLKEQLKPMGAVKARQSDLILAMVQLTILETFIARAFL